MTVAAPPPGWYPDQYGAVRWWDGQRWGQPAMPPAQPDSGRLFVMLAHLSAFVGGWILALIIRQTEGKKDRFVMHHATEALNFQITFFIPYLIAFVGFFATAGFFGSGTALPALAIVFLLVAVALAIGHAVLAIIGCLKASRGEWWRYPVNIRFVSGAVNPRLSTQEEVRVRGN